MNFVCWSFYSCVLQWRLWKCASTTMFIVHQWSYKHVLHLHFASYYCSLCTRRAACAKIYIFCKTLSMKMYKDKGKLDNVFLCLFKMTAFSISICGSLYLTSHGSNSSSSNVKTTQRILLNLAKNPKPEVQHTAVSPSFYDKHAVWIMCCV